MARMLFVTWKDGSPPSQFSVPQEFSFRDGPVQRLVVIMQGEEVEREIYLALELVRTGYLIDVPDNTFITHVEHASAD